MQIFESCFGPKTKNQKKVLGQKPKKSFGGGCCWIMDMATEVRVNFFGSDSLLLSSFVLLLNILRFMRSSTCSFDQIAFFQASQSPEAKRAGSLGQGGVVHLHGQERYRGHRLPHHRLRAQPGHRGVHGGTGELHIHLDRYD